MTLRVTFLGTSGAIPTPERNPIGIFVKREGDSFLFDVGEGVQRQMMRFSTGFDLDFVCLSHLHGDHIFGLPGLLETLDFNERQRKLTIFTPKHTERVLNRYLSAAVGTVSFPLSIEGLAAGEIAVKTAEYSLETFATDHDTRSIGYALDETTRPGRFDRERALELGVPEGPKFGQLQAGSSVSARDGSVVEPEEVLGPPRPGRRIAYTGDTRPTTACARAVSDGDLLIHESTFADDCVERADETGHATARQAGKLAATAGVERLVLIHISSRYAGEIGRHRAEAAEVFDGEIIVPDDGDTIDIPYPDA